MHAYKLLGGVDKQRLLFPCKRINPFQDFVTRPSHNGARALTKSILPQFLGEEGTEFLGRENTEFLGEETEFCWQHRVRNKRNNNGLEKPCSARSCRRKPSEYDRCRMHDVVLPASDKKFAFSQTANNRKLYCRFCIVKRKNYNRVRRQSAFQRQTFGIRPPSNRISGIGRFQSFKVQKL